MSLTKIKDIAKVISGYPFKSSDFIPDNGIPAIKIKNIKNGDVDLSECDFVDNNFLSLNEKYHLKRNDILVSLTGSHLTQPNSVVGRIALYRHSFVSLLNQRAGKIIPNTKLVDPLFLYAYLSQDSVKEFIAKKARGAANQANISPGDVEDTDIFLPPLPTQRRIASILSAYDDLIENNLKRIKLLYESAQLLYDKLVKEEIEFETVQLEDISIYLGRGVTPQYQDGSKFFAINQKANKGLFLEDQYFKEYKIGDWVPKDKFAKNGDVLINCLGEGTIGRCHFFKWEDNKYPVDQHMTIFRGITKEISLFVFQFLDSEIGQGLLYSLKKGGTNMTMLNISDLRSLKIDLPKERILSNHYSLIEPLFSQKAFLEKQNQKLKESRDILLPKLMNGTINVEKE